MLYFSTPKRVMNCTVVPTHEGKNAAANDVKPGGFLLPRFILFSFSFSHTLISLKLDTFSTWPFCKYKYKNSNL